MNVTREEVQRALNELVREGRLVAVEEIDSKSGELRNRYFLKDRAPKPN